MTQEYLSVLHIAAELFFDAAVIVDQLQIDEKSLLAVQNDLDRASSRLEPFRTRPAPPIRDGVMERLETTYDSALLVEADLTARMGQEFAKLFQSVPDDAYPRASDGLSILKLAKPIPANQLARLTLALAKLEAAVSVLKES